jgi:hypothetical protein
VLYLSHLISAASGKLNGLVASRNRGGSYMREYVIPVDPQTARQVDCRDALTELWQWWTVTMNAADRAAWEAYANTKQRDAKLGHTRTLPGWQAFCRQHYHKFQANEYFGNTWDPGAAPPINPATFGMIPTIAQSGADTMSFTFTDDNSWRLDQDNGFIVYLSDQQTQTRNFFKGPYKLAWQIAGNSEEPPEPPQTINYGTEFTPGLRVWYRIVFVSNDDERGGPYVGSFNTT